MPRHFMAFWRSETHDNALRNQQPISYAASSQFSRVDATDTVWIVSTRSGSLRLVGRIVVDQICDHDTAVQALGNEELWPAKLYVIAQEDSIRVVADVDIHHLVSELRFAGSSPQLSAKPDGTIDGRQLQTLRELASDSPQLLVAALGV